MYRRESDTVLYLADPVPRLDSSTLRDIIQRSFELPAPGTLRLCVHPDTQAGLHEMYIVHRKGSYLRPHRHVDKDEACIVVEGSMGVLFFDDHGSITERLLCGAYASGRIFHIRIPRGAWHCQVVLSPWVLFYEAATGPFKKEALEYAPFSPELDSDETEGYMRYLASRFT